MSASSCGTPIPTALSQPVYTVLRYAADQLAGGAWGWHHGDKPYPDEHCCLLTAVTRAARECDSIQTAYDAVRHVEWYLGSPLGPWNDTRGRTLQQVVDALRGAALLS